MNQMRGKQSIQFDKAPYLIASSSVVGAKEGEGPLGMMFDRVNEDAQFGEDTWEKAESQMQKEAAQIVLEKAGMMPENIRYLFSGDLLGQLTATSFGAGGMDIPMFGLYGDFQPFCKCRKAVSLSPGICQSKTSCSNLDSDRKRGIFGGRREEK